MKILFIQQNGLQESLGIASISALLKTNGHQTTLRLLSHTPDIIAAVRQEDPGLIAFSALTGVHAPLLRVARELKKHFSVPIVMGGPHATFSPQVIENPGIDIVCRGEGEFAMLELVDSLENRRDITAIKNLYVKSCDGQVHKNDLRPPADLDALPLPDRELYYRYTFLRDMPMKRFITSLGCPYRCTFCHEPIISDLYQGEYYRRKSVERVVQEIRFIQDRYPLRTVHFSDDLFLVHGQLAWLKEFADHYPREVGLPFCCNLRYDGLSEESVKLLKEARCHGVAVGIESGDDRLREDLLGKKISRDQMFHGAELLRRQGIKTLTTNLIGLPGETLEQAFATVHLNRLLKSHYTRANTLVAFEGLPLVDDARREQLVEDKFIVEEHENEPLEVVFKSPFKRDFRNLAALFWIFVHLPMRWTPALKKIVSWPDNALFRLLGALNLFQELLFFRIPFLPGWRYFYHTILRSRDKMTLRNVPVSRK